MGFISSTLFGSAGQAPDWQAQNYQPSAQDQAAFLQAQGNQQSVFNQLQAVASGQGPNPAQAMLNQATGQNIASQAALQAGQRGAGANAGLIARQAGQQGAATQQQSVGQGATMQAQQQLGALGQLGGIANQQAQTQLSAQAQQLQNIQQQNQYNAGQAGINTQNAAKLTGGILSGLGSAVLGAGAGGAPGVGGAASAPGGAAAEAGSNVSDYTSLAHGGTVKRMAAGGHIPAPPPSSGSEGSSGLGTVISILEHVLAKGGKVEHSAPKSAYGKHLKGSKVPALLSPGEKYLTPQQAKQVAAGHKSPMEGKTIPGQAKVKGDSLKNDTVPASLEEGGIVIPRSVMQSKNPSAAAAKFVQDHLKKGKK